MDVAAFDDLPQPLKDAAIESFVASYNRYKGQAEESQYRLNQAMKSVESIRKELEDNITKQHKFEELIRLLHPHQTDRPVSSISSSLRDVQTRLHSEIKFRLQDEHQKRRIKYGGVRPKERIAELLKTSKYLMTDEELLRQLQHELGIDEIPLKTVQNNLYELVSENVVKRFKSKELDEFLNGIPEMFDENESPKTEYLRAK